MKRMVTLLLVLCLILSGCSSGTTEQTTIEQTEAEAKPETLEQFIDKYKRADWSTFTTSVVELIDDFNYVFSKGVSWSENKDAYNPGEEENGWIEYKSDIILYGKPFELGVIEHNGTEASGTLRYECEGSDCYELGMSVFDSFAKAKGDADYIELDDVAVSEPELRKAISAGIEEGSVLIRWGSVEENNAFTIRCYHYYKQPGYLVLY